MQQWEYRVIHINVNNDAPPQPPSAQSASQKLGGALSPEFIAKEFPKMYSKLGQQSQAKPKHPAEQLQYFLNQLGSERWELVETTQVGPLLMFFFKRPKQQPESVDDVLEGEKRPSSRNANSPAGSQSNPDV